MGFTHAVYVNELCHFKRLCIVRPKGAIQICYYYYCYYMTYCYPTLSAIEKAYTKTGPSAGYPHMQLSVMYVSGVGSIPMKSRTDIVKF